MPKNKMKKVFDSYFNEEKMKEKILLNNEKKSISTFMKYSMPICLTMICTIVIIISSNNNIENNLNNTFSKGENEINIVETEVLEVTRLDADIKEISIDTNENSYLKELKEKVIIPDYLNDFNSYSIYTRINSNSNYDILNCYVYNYYNTELESDIRISFSNTNKPIRDYQFEETANLSNINGIDLPIYKYENLYFTEFPYDGYNFDIETTNINLEELLTVLKSII